MNVDASCTDVFTGLARFSLCDSTALCTWTQQLHIDFIQDEDWLIIAKNRLANLFYPYIVLLAKGKMSSFIDNVKSVADNIGEPLSGQLCMELLQIILIIRHGHFR